MGAENPQPAFQSAKLSLDQCLDFAFKNSQQIKAAVKSVEIAKVAVREVEGNFWPKLGILYSPTNLRVFTLTPGLYSLYASTDYSGALI